MFAWAATGTFHYEFVINKILGKLIKHSGIGQFMHFSTSSNKLYSESDPNVPFTLEYTVTV